MRSWFLAALAAGCAQQANGGAWVADAAASDSAGDVWTALEAATTGDSADATGAQDAPPDVSATAAAALAPATLAALNEFAMGQLAKAHVASCAAAVVKKHALAWQGAWGVADVAQNKPATAETVYMLASVSKTVTAVGAMRAVEMGAIGLDQDVNSVLPFAVRHPQFASVPITLRLLLTHFSGIADNWDVMDTTYVAGDSPVPLGEFLHDYLVAGAKYWNAKQNWGSKKPGTSYDYSDIGVSLAAYAVERATKTPFDQWCAEQIFAPLKMPATSFRLKGLDASQIAVPYAWSKSKGYVSFGLYGYPDYPDGGLRSSPPQMARFLLMFADGGSFGGQQVLAPTSVAEMKKVQYPDLDGEQLLTWYTVERKGQTYVGHNGGDRGIYTEMFYRPSDGVGVLLFCNGEAEAGTAAETAILALEQRLFEVAAEM